MIKLKEVRLGNWVQVVGIYKESILRAGMALVDSELIRIADEGRILLIGIPLTPEILEKAGFEFGVMPFTSEGGYSKRGSGYFIGFTENHANGWLFHNPHFDRNYKYVHQLQNLYFALTGEELEIEL